MPLLHDGSAYNDDPTPEYRVSVTRSNTTNSNGSGSTRWRSPFDDPPAPIKSVASVSNFQLPSYTDLGGSASRRLPQILPERYVYNYRVTANGALLQYIISVEPQNGTPAPGKCTFRLSLKVDKVERPLEEAVSLTLMVDPRHLDFIVFMFPGRSVNPEGCLYSYRVWLRVNGIDHRLFGDDDLWVAKDPDFTSIPEASFSRLKSITSNMQIYDAVVANAHIQFIVRWQQITDELYKYSMEYDANGVGGMLIDDFRLMLQGDPRKVSFLIYTVPMTSMPAGASHRIRVWLKTLTPLSGDLSPKYSIPYNDSYTYQRIWKSDNFKIGAHLNFSSLGPKMLMGHASGPPKTVVMSSEGNQQFKSTNLVELG